jgi:hypothetical protein
MYGLRAVTFRKMGVSAVCLVADWLLTFLQEWILLSAVIGRRMKHASI